MFVSAINGTVPFSAAKLQPPELWNAALDEAVRIQEYVRDQVYVSRKKDYDNPFRQTTFRNAEEMKAVLGTAEDNSFVKQVQQETELFKQQGGVDRVARGDVPLEGIMPSSLNESLGQKPRLVSLACLFTSPRVRTRGTTDWRPLSLFVAAQSRRWCDVGRE